MYRLVAYCLKMLVSGVGNSGTSVAAIWSMWLAVMSAELVVPPTDEPATIVGVSPESTVISPVMMPGVPVAGLPMVMGGSAVEVEIMLARSAGMPVICLAVSMIIVPLLAMPHWKKSVGCSCVR